MKHSLPLNLQGKKIMIRSAAIAALLVPLFLGIASAEQRTTVIQGKEYIVHSNPVPVVVHRVLPPYWNKHVTARELKSGKLPAGRR